MEKEYAALMIDLKGSRKLDDEMRKDIQIYWDEIRRRLNDMFCGTMEFKVDFSGGDQIQGLFYTPEAAYLYYRLFSMCTHPVQTHGGIGIGSWSVKMVGKPTGSQDGTAYHRAKAASDLADADIGYPILLNSENIDRDRIINSLIGTAALRALEHTAHQNQIMLLTELLYPISEGYMELDRDAYLINSYELICLKNDFDREFTGSKKKVTKKELPLESLLRQNSNSFVRATVRKAAKAKNPTNYVTEGKGRGIPKTLEEVLGIKYQSINTTLKAADIFNIRNLSVAALEAMRHI
jgi:hypothetical protein